MYTYPNGGVANPAKQLKGTYRTGGSGRVGSNDSGVPWHLLTTHQAAKKLRPNKRDHIHSRTVQSQLRLFLTDTGWGRG